MLVVSYESLSHALIQVLMEKLTLHYLTEGRKATLPLIYLKKGGQLVNPVLPRLGIKGTRSY
jgi:hypothetical protein